MAGPVDQVLDGRARLTDGPVEWVRTAARRYLLAVRVSSSTARSIRTSATVKLTPSRWNWRRKACPIDDSLHVQVGYTGDGIHDEMPRW
jgi:hypothetical protein